VENGQSAQRGRHCHRGQVGFGWMTPIHPWLCRHPDPLSQNGPEHAEDQQSKYWQKYIKCLIKL
jgi:hypothetical protein